MHVTETSVRIVAAALPSLPHRHCDAIDESARVNGDTEMPITGRHWTGRAVAVTYARLQRKE